jgi:hypothetical protein
MRFTPAERRTLCPMCAGEALGSQRRGPGAPGISSIQTLAVRSKKPRAVPTIFGTFTDDCTRMTFLYLLHSKSSPDGWKGSKISRRNLRWMGELLGHCRQMARRNILKNWRRNSNSTTSNTKPRQHTHPCRFAEWSCRAG